MGTEKAREILAEGQFIPPAAARSAKALIDLAEEHTTDFAGWYTAIEDADTRSLVAAMGKLGSHPGVDQRQISFREAARSMVELKLAELMVAKMEDLERASERLARNSLAVAVVGVFVAIVGLILAA